jgi:hypothetical protein
MATAEDPGDVVAVRSFRNDAGATVLATISQPKVLGDDKWACRFRISGLPTQVEDLDHPEVPKLVTSP